ncbi:YbaK/EbsC family protein [Paenarthrobacter sp. PH39-S1]|uniref:YbaK/EbsC family protein n=1 Tax=Paenarthrobacter sp. PH39-S1 TaxID=3046204 RepID=UPI0024BACBED|nr:YbaK/EbsC family protein [Paenarthrobacter sp. PH39-S1]MDJ0358383.1 YbaK/EbsC family protein [Paenarthrobacter sp. PH39-S1]
MGKERLSHSSQSVADALREAGALGQVRVLPDSTRTAVEAAQALGCEVGAIANSLVFMCDGGPLLVLTSGSHRVDTKALATGLERGKIHRATPEQVRAATGQAIGGVAPVGHPVRVETVVDETLADYPMLWASAGTPHSVFPTDYKELLSLTRGRSAKVD